MSDSEASSEIQSLSASEPKDNGNVRQKKNRARRNRLTTVNHVPTSSYFPSESLFLAFLFALIIMILPNLFYYISKQALRDKELSNGTNSPPDSESLTTSFNQNVIQPFAKVILSNLPRISVALSYFYSGLRAIAYPLTFAIDVLTSICLPLFIFIRLLLQAFVIIPFNFCIAALQFLYPVYVFVGIACLTGGVIGVSAKLLMEFLKLAMS